MVARLQSAILLGIDAIVCKVEADVAHGGQGEINPAPADETEEGLQCDPSR